MFQFVPRLVRAARDRSLVPEVRLSPPVPAAHSTGGPPPGAHSTNTAAHSTGSSSSSGAFFASPDSAAHSTDSAAPSTGSNGGGPFHEFSGALHRYQLIQRSVLCFPGFSGSLDGFSGSLHPFELFERSVLCVPGFNGSLHGFSGSLNLLTYLLHRGGAESRKPYKKNSRWSLFVPFSQRILALRLIFLACDLFRDAS